MIPAANGYLEDLEIEEMPTKTYKIRITSADTAMKEKH